ncbi:uncharacterized protein LOC108655184 [Drosophila navojoa]|uniref:uncharacterized protein LOC108655184 n=1 Tax=Drosophila navojoa TaxID=7232 RepID=UPI000847C4BB|nr:uncharacterized protein LOC108655184 [Drosophila navojoa]
MKYLCLFIWLIWLVQANASVGDLPTFTGVCALQGDWCTTRCQIAGGRDGICNKMQLCICRPL